MKEWEREREKEWVIWWIVKNILFLIYSFSHQSALIHFIHHFWGNLFLNIFFPFYFFFWNIFISKIWNNFREYVISSTYRSLSKLVPPSCVLSKIDITGIFDVVEKPNGSIGGICSSEKARVRWLSTGLYNVYVLKMKKNQEK